VGGDLVRINGGEMGETWIEHDLGDVENLLGQSGGKAHALPAVALGRDAAQDLLDGGGEAGIEHLVGLVEDQRLEVCEALTHLFLAQDVVEAARGGNEDRWVAVHEGLEVRRT